jgi:hypothetical protein
MFTLSKDAYDVKRPRKSSTAWCERKVCQAHRDQKWWISRSGVRICAICATPPQECVTSGAGLLLDAE